MTAPRPAPYDISRRRSRLARGVVAALAAPLVGLLAIAPASAGDDAADDTYAPGISTTTIWDEQTPLVDSRGRTTDGLLGGSRRQGVGEIELAGSGEAVVAEKRGRLVYFAGTGADEGVVLTERDGSDLTEDTFAINDAGMGGIAIDPMWPRRPYLYALYTSNRKVPSQGTGRWTAAECEGTQRRCIVTGTLERLTVRFRSVGGERLPYIAQRRRLVADEWCQIVDVHSVGDLVFGRDGQLYASAGDGTPNGAERPLQREHCGGATGDHPRMGALDVLDEDADEITLNGKIIRVNPATGLGSHDNPDAGSSDPNRARVVAAGFRNPYRMALQPGSSTIAVSMVGEDRHESVYELDDLTSGVEEHSVGWPCWEVSERFQVDDACGELAPTGSTIAPTVAWRQDQPLADEPCPADRANAAMGVAYWGRQAPAEYRGDLVFGDYGRGCLWRLDEGEPTFVAWLPRHSVRDLTTGPGGDIYFPDYAEGSVRRLDVTASS